jgi:hypothetical protein
VRQVAEEARLARIAGDDLRPAVPGERPPVGEVEVEELVGARLPATAEADERPDVADLVGRVGVPVGGAGARASISVQKRSKVASSASTGREGPSPPGSRRVVVEVESKSPRSALAGT